ncbi:hypothetical protein R3Q06_35560 [Rhodococcus erythropolis]|uniref:hypothetical protein n=1 Tax=Rhodococcus erythropolis TaxID=1833 RepID=UPI00294942D3|nr:hypothetical protein [Rhodococcus erythropolis]MDV6278691.1 hypothetical protein [Rhodococcus erythropolis]
MTTSTMSRRRRLRKLAYAPLVAAVAAGAVCVGPGTGAAATTAAAGPIYWGYDWSLVNRTGQPIYGDWNVTMESGASSHVEAPDETPWQPDDVAETTQYEEDVASSQMSWTGHICYNTHWWDYMASDFGFAHDPGARVVTLEADSAGALFVYPDARYRRDAPTALKRQHGTC